MADQTVKSLAKQIEWEKAKGSLRAMLPTFHLQGEKRKIFEYKLCGFIDFVENHPQDLLDYKDNSEGPDKIKRLEDKGKEDKKL